MVARFAQVTFVLLIVANVRSAAGDAPRGKYAQQLQSECRQLIADAVEKPYGIAWGDTPAVGKGTAARPVSMEPGGSPAAAIVLLWAGDLLDDPSLKDAAKKAAAAVMASQAASGQIAPIAIFGDSPDAKTSDALFPDRASTRAGMALMLSVLDTQLNKDPKLLESVDLASRWLGKQQVNGAWMRASEGGKTFIRLDDSDFRDSTFAMQLELEVLDRPDARQAVERAVSRLGGLQLSGMNDFLPGARLWSTRYNNAGEPVEDGGRPKDTADLLSSRYAAQTLLGVAICWGQRATVAELDRAGQRIEQLRRPEGNWKRFEAVGSPTPVDGPTGEFGLPPLLASIKAIKNLGPERYKQLMTRGWSPKHHLAAAVVGLNDTPFTLAWPVAATEVDAYLKARDADWVALQGEIPQLLPDRVKRLWVLLQRAKLEGIR